MDWAPPPGAYGTTDPLFLLLIALAVEAYLGERGFVMRWLPQPRRIMSRLVSDLDRRLNRPSRGPRVLLLRGCIVVLALVVAAGAAGWLLALLTRHYPFAWVFEALLLVLLVAQRSTGVRLAAVTAALANGSLVQARDAVQHLAGGRFGPAALERLDRSRVVRTALASLAERFAGGLIGPVFWYVLFGLPGLLIHQMLSVGSTRYRAIPGQGQGPPSAAPTESHYGLPFLWSYQALAYLPDRLAGLLLALAALFVPRGRPLAALRRLPGSGDWPQAALGAGLGLTEVERDATANPRLLAAALVLFAVGCLINAGLVAGAALIRLWL